MNSIGGRTGIAVTKRCFYFLYLVWKVCVLVVKGGVQKSTLRVAGARLTLTSPLALGYVECEIRMSKITKVWKRQIGPTVSDIWFRYRGLPRRKDTLTVQEYTRETSLAGQKSSCTLHPHGSLDQLFPRRPVYGDLESANRLIERIEDSKQRDAFVSRIYGEVRGQGEELVADLRDGRVTHDAGVILTPDRRLLSNLSELDFANDFPSNPLRQRYFPPSHPVHGRTAVITCLSNYNYYHWFLDALPRLRGYRELGLEVDWYYAPRKYRFQRDSLAMLGIPVERTLTVKRRAHYQAEQLLVSFKDSQTEQWATRERTDFLHDAFTANLPREPERPLRVIISRRRRGKRILVNELDVLRKLSPLGFRRYDLESMSVAQQAALFYRAECVIGPHGAGLVNLVFCRPGTKVIEIGTPHRPHPCFHAIAHHRRLDYQVYFANPVAPSPIPPESGQGESNMFLPTDAFARHVHEFLTSIDIVMWRKV